MNFLPNLLKESFLTRNVNFNSIFLLNVVVMDIYIDIPPKVKI